MQKKKNIYESLALITGQSKTDLLLARLYFEFDFAEMHELELDVNLALDWYNRTLDVLIKQPLREAA
jgi:hypothetical protein